MNDLQQAQTLIKQCGSQYRAAQVFERETGYKIAISTMNRIVDGKAKPAMIAFVRYGLTRAQSNAVTQLNDQLHLRSHDM